MFASTMRILALVALSWAPLAGMAVARCYHSNNLGTASVMHTESGSVAAFPTKLCAGNHICAVAVVVYVAPGDHSKLEYTLTNDGTSTCFGTIVLHNQFRTPAGPPGQFKAGDKCIDNTPYIYNRNFINGIILQVVCTI